MSQAEHLPLRDIADAAADLERLINTVPDSPRQRFMGCMAAAARFAVDFDAPPQDGKERLWALMNMAVQSLDDWLGAPGPF